MNGSTDPSSYGGEMRAEFISEGVLESTTEKAMSTALVDQTVAHFRRLWYSKPVINLIERAPCRLLRGRRVIVTEPGIRRRVLRNVS